MADNVTVDNGGLTDFIVSSDEASSGQVQRVKLTYSADGSDTHISADASGLQVQLGAAIPTGGNNIGDVDVLSLPALPAGSNAIGKLAANSGVDIGDVDVTSVVPGTGATNLGKAIGNAAGATDTGVAGLFVRDDALSELSDAEGDYVPARVDSIGRQHMAITGQDGEPLSFAAPAVLAADPTISTSAMAALDSMHTTIITFANAAVAAGRTGTILGASLHDKADQTFTARLWLFNQSFTGTTGADPLSVSDTDNFNAVGWVDFLSFADGAVGKFAMGDRAQLPMPYLCSTTTSLFGVLQVLSGTPTFGASDIRVKLHVVKD